MDHETGRSRGFAHVEMSNLVSLEKGLTANNAELLGRRLNVDVGRPPIDRRGGHTTSHRDRDNNHRGGDNRNQHRGGERDRDQHYDRDRGGPAQDITPIERGLKGD